MKFALVALLVVPLVVASIHDHGFARRDHTRQALARRIKSNRFQKRCVPKDVNNVKAPDPATDLPPKDDKPADGGKPTNNGKPAGDTEPPTDEDKPPPYDGKPKDNKPPTNSNPDESPKGLLAGVTSACGGPGATENITSTSGPNGNFDFFNCGIETDGGWQPPKVGLHQIVTIELGVAMNKPDTPFGPCRPFQKLFEAIGAKYGIPPMYLVAIAFQESTCNPNAVGGGGEQGMMQITQEKCQGSSNCRSPEFNIDQGAKYFKSLVDTVPSIFEVMGMYNGWQRGMTKAGATKARDSNCCRCQNNLDYLAQIFNGWLQGVDAYALGIGKYFNLQVCH